MKKQFYFLLSLVALFAVACESDPTLMADLENPLAVNFSAAITTRATDTAFELGDGISVTAYETNGSVYAQNASYIYAGSSFLSSSPIEYEDTEQELSFLAVYPYVEVPESKVIDFEVKSDQSSGSNYTLSDLMLSYCPSTSSTSPQLTFNHLLTKVVISITSSDVSMLNAVATLNAMTNVEYNLSTLSVTTSGSASAITMASDGVLSYKAIVAPQTVSSTSPLGAITADGNTFSFYYTSDVTMAAGKEYTFPATIFNGEIIFDEPLINNWDKGEVTTSSTELALAYFSETSYPTDTDTWIITDASATTDDFEGLKAAIRAIASEDDTRRINIEFSNLSSLPEKALYLVDEIEIDEDEIDEDDTIDRELGCQTLYTISAPNAITIGDYALSNNEMLNSVSLPNATTFGDFALSCCIEIDYIYLPEAITLGDNVFVCCISLESVSLPNATTFGSWVFSDCGSLESVSLPSATTFGGYTFYGCALVEVSIATNSGVVISAFGDGGFNGVNVVNDVEDLSNITLNIGSANSSMKDGLYFNAPNGEGGTTIYGEFKEINII